MKRFKSEAEAFSKIEAARKEMAFSPKDCFEVQLYLNSDDTKSYVIAMYSPSTIKGPMNFCGFY